MKMVTVDVGRVEIFDIGFGVINSRDMMVDQYWK